VLHCSVAANRDETTRKTNSIESGEPIQREFLPFSLHRTVTGTKRARRRCRSAFLEDFA